jgi:hypothetical protein
MDAYLADYCCRVFLLLNIELEFDKYNDPLLLLLLLL